VNQFGSLDEVLERTPQGRNLLASVGPVADAFVLGREPMMLLNGPIGSAKTASLARKNVFEATRMLPWNNGVRTYVVTKVRDKYVNMWTATIPSWWKLFPKEAFPEWNGSDGRPANHVVRWRDQWGDVELIAKFRAFGEAGDEEDTRGWECTDAEFDEWDLMEERFTTALSGRTAREPARDILGRPGRMYGACNAPDVTSYIFRDFWENPPPGYRLYRQPGGLDPGAEYPPGISRAYYDDLIAKNVHRPWYIKRMVHNRPGFTRDADVVYPGFDDDRHMAKATIPVIPSLPVLVGVDGGLTPAAVWMQELPKGQLRVLAHVALETSGMIALSREMLRVEAQRFPKCEFVSVCDPSMAAGEETEERSDRARLSELLGRRVELAPSNNPEERHDPLRRYMERTLETGEPALTIDPSCMPLRRGFNQTFCYHRARGSNERSRVVKNPDSHPCEAAEYAAMETGHGHARLLESQRRRERDARAKRAKESGRYNPLARRAS